MGVQRSNEASASPFCSVSGRCRLENESSVRCESAIECDVRILSYVRVEAVDAMVRERELQGLQIEMRPALISPTQRTHPRPPRPEYRHQAPRELRPPVGVGSPKYSSFRAQAP